MRASLGPCAQKPVTTPYPLQFSIFVTLIFNCMHFLLLFTKKCVCTGEGVYHSMYHISGGHSQAWWQVPLLTELPRLPACEPFPTLLYGPPSGALQVLLPRTCVALGKSLRVSSSRFPLVCQGNPSTASLIISG